MKKTSISKSSNAESQDMMPEYDFDYSKARLNRFATGSGKERLIEELFAAADRLADLDEPLSEAEVNAEIAAVRKNRRAS